MTNCAITSTGASNATNAHARAKESAGREMSANVVAASTAASTYQASAGNP